MKKVTSFLIIFIILLFPFQVLSCPHVDKNKIPHFQFYSEDYTTMSMLYPREGHLYSKDVPFDGINYEDEILNESFGFPLVQDKQTYWQNYWFADQRFQDPNWDNLEIKTTIEGINTLLVNGNNFNLNVGLKNTFIDSRKYVDDKVYQMYYNVFTDRLNDDSETKYSNLIKQSNLSLVVPEVLQIRAEYSIIGSLEDDYNVKNVKINEFYDDVEIQIKSNNIIENVVALNINKSINSSNYIECSYNNDGKFYSFKTSEAGVYVIAKKTDRIVETEVIKEKHVDKEMTNDDSDDLSSEKSLNLMKEVTITIGIISTIIIFIVVKMIKKPI